MVDAISHIARNTAYFSFSWGHNRPYVANLLSKQNDRSTNRATILLSPYLDPYQWDKKMVTGWAAAASRVLYSEEVGIGVVDTLLQLGRSDTLRPEIPIGIWALLKEQPTLPPFCNGRRRATQELVRYLRELGDLDILKSYFVVVWSDWDYLGDSHFSETKTSIVEDFDGLGMQHHRADLIKRLDHILGELNREYQHFRQVDLQTNEGYFNRRKTQYTTLRKLLLEADKKATRVLAGMSLRLTGFNRSTDSRGYVQNHIQPLPVLCLSRFHDFVAWSR